MVYENDKPSAEAQQPHLLTWSFERQPGYENLREGSTYAVTCIQKQAVETTSVLQINLRCVQGYYAKKGRKKFLSLKMQLIEL